MSSERLLAWLAERDPEEEGVMLLEPRSQFDPALIGVVERFNSVFAIYSRSKILAALEADMDRESAVEHFNFNILGSWVGEGTPGFLLDDEEDDDPPENTDPPPS